MQYSAYACEETACTDCEETDEIIPRAAICSACEIGYMFDSYSYGSWYVFYLFLRKGIDL
ncbi:MAG: hypothetical protein R3Y47_12190 [Lachnospiraceae bacterium]